MLVLYAGTLFLSAFLLFLVQPMFAKAVLPLLGGSAGVWNTALVFFQGSLLAGYAAVHLGARLWSAVRQAWLHVALLAVGAVSLPIGVAEGWTPPASQVPTGWLLALCAVSIGLPFFATASLAPLLQRLLAHTDHARARDPYFLYAASNAGSLLALLAYPTVVEPALGLAGQGRLWTAGYGVLVVGLAACAARAGGRPVPSAEPLAQGAAPGAGERLRWVLLAFAPSSLLLGVTAHLSNDVAAVPLLWVVPLALYLSTFVVAFARRSPGAQRGLLAAQTPLVALALVTLFVFRHALAVVFPIHLAAFAVTALVCHGELAARRPAPAHLTGFYLWMSLGGVLGGAFNALLAPLLFTSRLEYPLVLIAACALRPRRAGRRFETADAVVPGLAAAVLLAVHAAVGLRPESLGTGGFLLVFGGLIGLAVACHGRPLRLAAGMALLAVGLDAGLGVQNVIEQRRSFFGVHTVRRDGSGEVRLLVHGTTIHGAQYVAPERWREPLAYYGPASPVAELVRALPVGRPRRVGVVGLGVGALACHARPGDVFRFFEIDPVVVQLARGSPWFHYLSACAPDAAVVVGDGRRMLAREPAGTFDLLVLDAFSSDAVPVHLLTQEALALYVEKLRPDGVIAFHVSSRQLELRPLLANAIAAAGLAGSVQRHEPAPGSEHAYGSTWVVAARDGDALAERAPGPDWQAARPDRSTGVWTDDFSNILDVVPWRFADVARGE